MASTKGTVPLASLSPVGQTMYGQSVAPMGTGKTMSYRWLAGGVILAAAVWLLLYTTKPMFIMAVGPDGRPTGEIDNMSLMLWVFVGFLLGAFIGAKQ